MNSHKYFCEYCGVKCNKTYKRVACSVICRFMLQVNKTDNCWFWTGKKNSYGYGVIMVNGIRKVATRIAYELFKGEKPNDLYVCHSCDNPSCVNPDHLWLGTNKENQLDALKKGRLATGEKSHFHKFSDNQILQIYDLLREGESKSRIMHDFQISDTHLRRLINNEARINLCH